MADDLLKACGTNKIFVLFDETTDLMSNIYRYKTELRNTHDLVEALSVICVSTFTAV